MIVYAVMSAVRELPKEARAVLKLLVGQWESRIKTIATVS